MSNSFHPRIGLSITPEERHIINMYMSQYNQTNVQINRLYTTLDSIRTNINNIVNNIVNNNRDNRANRDNRDNMTTINSTVEPAQSATASATTATTATNATTASTASTAYPRTTPTPITHAYPPTANAAYSNTNNRHNTNNRRSNSNNNRYIFYDYDRPISPTTYVDDEVFTPVNISDNINTLLAAFLATPVTVRPTEAQISAATRIIRYSDIENPASTACPISLDNFSENDNVRQINHCGHVFSLNSIDEWFQNNVRCPVCRYDIRLATAEASGPDLFEPPLTNPSANARPNIRTNTRQNTSSNTISNARQATTDALDSITTSLFESLLLYPARINGTRTPRSTTTNTNTNTNTNVNDNDNDDDERLTYDASQNTLTYETTFRPYHR